MTASRPRAFLSLAVLAALVPGLLAPAAGAKPVELTGLTARMALRGSHGYRLTIEAFADTVELTARAPGGAEAEYVVPGAVTARRVRANLGRFGRVAVRFRASSSVHRSKGRGCDRESETLEKGAFTGAIHFRGEEGFTAVAATRTSGSVTQSSAFLCSGAGARPAPRARSAAAAAASSRVRRTIFGAGRRKAGHGTGFLFDTEALVSQGVVTDPEAAFINVQTVERRGRMEIERRAIFEAPSRSLAIEGGPGTSLEATLRLPAPFAGTAAYSVRGEGEGSWRGDLRVPLPGAPSTALAGPSFRSILCRGNVDAPKLKDCSEEANTFFFNALLPAFP